MLNNMRNEKERWLFEYRFDDFVLRLMSRFISRIGSSGKFS